jgi:hypothetical protein
MLEEAKRQFISEMAMAHFNHFTPPHLEPIGTSNLSTSTTTAISIFTPMDLAIPLPEEILEMAISNGLATSV